MGLGATEGPAAITAQHTAAGLAALAASGDPAAPDTPGSPHAPAAPGDPAAPDTPGNPHAPAAPGGPAAPETPDGRAPAPPTQREAPPALAPAPPAALPACPPMPPAALPPPAPDAPGTAGAREPSPAVAGTTGTDARQRPRCPPRTRVSSRWAMLLARIYEVLPLVCRRCGQPMRLIAFITQPATLTPILRHIGEPTTPPPLAPARLAYDNDRPPDAARAPPDALVHESPGDLDFTDPPAPDDVADPPAPDHGL